MGRILFVVFISLLSEAAPPWFEHYEQGLLELKQGRHDRAIQALEAAVAQRPEPGLKVPTRSSYYADYLPYLHLAVAAQKAGRHEAARGYLVRSDEAGVAARSEEGRRLLAVYRELLGIVPRPTPAGADPPGPRYAEYERRREVLSEEEFLEVKRNVLMRCGLDARDEREAPWYYHYELGLELAERQDPQRALDALVEAAERRPEPRYAARMYGMWFVDYLPYFEIAKQHIKLGNRECAADALRLSREHKEVRSEDKRFAEFLALQEELEQ